MLLDSAGIPNVALGNGIATLRRAMQRYRVPRLHALSSAHARQEQPAEEGTCMVMALQRGAWTRNDLDRLPDDGNRYEAVNGELFVTPAPAPTHETVVLRLLDLLRDYVARYRLGQVSTRWRLIFRGSSVEPDLAVGHIPLGDSWDEAPTPVLVVEVLSATTQSRDRVQKRVLYLEAHVQEYWMVDRERLCITVARAGREDTEFFEVMDWRPRGGVAPLRFDVREVFRPFEQNQG